jgi:acyl-CoA reductase-like NAD-dependent aldehyde dehydrogenase
MRKGDIELSDFVRIRPRWPLWLANEERQPNADLPVFDKYDGRELGRVAMADSALITEAFTAAEAAREAMARLPAFQRRDILVHCVRRFGERAEEFARVLCCEAGKPIRDARGEVSRLIDSFRVAAEESTRIGGEILDLEITPRSRGYTGMYRRFPIGVCSFITPFNYPLNLVAHKIAPAIASGCPFVLKPASLTPLSALLLGEVLAETDLPKGAFSILPTRRDGAALFTEDPRPKLLSFTGSPAVGWELKARAGRKKVVLELGGNAAVVVEPDADLADATERILIGAFSNSGQSCIGVQRVLIHEEIYAPLRARLVKATKGLCTGDPHAEATVVGPVISEAEAVRLESWINEAKARGATILCGGDRDGSLLQPTLLEGVPRELPLCAAEAFGPVAILAPYRDFEAALDMVNDSEFGLQAGVFTADLEKAHRAWERLEVGGVVIGDIPSWRVEHMPYGGVKASGIGREGIRFAMEDMSEMRLLIIRRRAAHDH